MQNKKNISSPFSASHAGFTLLELIVVMVLVGVVMSTVTPRLYHSLDHYRADAEERALAELAERASYRAFFQHRELTLHFAENSVRTADDQQVASFAFLRFPAQTLIWNGHGFPSAGVIQVTVAGREKEVDLRSAAGYRP